MASKLTIEQKVEIALTGGESLRAFAKKYGVHHSCIAEIKKESRESICRYWQEKADQVGRPSNKVLPEQAVLNDSRKKIEKLEYDLALKTMRIGFLELKLKWDDERFAEAGIEKGEQLKKKKSQT